MTPVFYELSEDDRLKAGVLAMEANQLLASGTTLQGLSRPHLTAYIIMRELDLSIALSEAVRRDEGIQGIPDNRSGFLQ